MYTFILGKCLRVERNPVLQVVLTSQDTPSFPNRLHNCALRALYESRISPSLSALSVSPELYRPCRMYVLASPCGSNVHTSNEQWCWMLLFITLMEPSLVQFAAPLQIVKTPYVNHTIHIPCTSVLNIDGVLFVIFSFENVGFFLWYYLWNLILYQVF